MEEAVADFLPSSTSVGVSMMKLKNCAMKLARCVRKLLLLRGDIVGAESCQRGNCSDPWSSGIDQNQRAIEDRLASLLFAIVAANADGESVCAHGKRNPDAVLPKISMPPSDFGFQKKCVPICWSGRQCALR